MHIAAFANASKSMRILCDYCRQNDCREDLNLKTGDDRKVTPLMIAAKMGFIDVAKELLYAGCNRNVKCERGSTAEQYAEKSNHKRLADIIRRGGEEEEEEDEDVDDGDLSDDAPEGETPSQRSRRKKRERKLLDEERFGDLAIGGEANTAGDVETKADEKYEEEHDFDEDKARWDEVKTTLLSMKSVTSSNKELYVKRSLLPDEEIDPLLWKCSSLNLLSLQITRTCPNKEEDSDVNEVGGLPIVPDGLLSMTNLLTLILSKNQIEKLPSDMGEHLTQLRYLDLSDNNLNDLPSSFKKLSALSTVNFNNNKLTSIAALAKLENITIIQADSNEITSIEDLNLKNKVRLETLSLADNSLSLIPDEISHCKQLRKLILLNNDEIKDIPSALCNTKKLQTIRINSKISDNKINKMFQKNAKDGDDAGLIKALIPYLKKTSGSKKK